MKKSLAESFRLSYYQPIINKLKYPLPFYIRKTLGLYELSNKSYCYAGHTTKMLVEAVYFSQNRKVYIAGHNYSYTNNLVNQAKKMCIKLNIPYTNILPLPSRPCGINFKNSFVYIDHYNSYETYTNLINLYPKPWRPTIRSIYN